jgi:hypothetical protein
MDFTVRYTPHCETCPGVASEKQYWKATYRPLKAFRTRYFSYDTCRIGLDIPDGNLEFRNLPNIRYKTMVKKNKAIPVTGRGGP